MSRDRRRSVRSGFKALRRRRRSGDAGDHRRASRGTCRAQLDVTVEAGRRLGTALVGHRVDPGTQVIAAAGSAASARATASPSAAPPAPASRLHSNWLCRCAAAARATNTVDDCRLKSGDPGLRCPTRRVGSASARHANPSSELPRRRAATDGTGACSRNRRCRRRSGSTYAGEQAAPPDRDPPKAVRKSDAGPGSLGPGSGGTAGPRTDAQPRSGRSGSGSPRRDTGWHAAPGACGFTDTRSPRPVEVGGTTGAVARPTTRAGGRRLVTAGP